MTTCELFESKTVGYFILDSQDRDEEGFSESSLKALRQQGHERKLPLINWEKIRQLNSKSGLKIRKIHGSNLSIPSIAVGWKPTTRFLYNMWEARRYKELEIPNDCFLIRTNRKTIMELIDFFQQPMPNELPLKVKLTKKEYGKHLTLLYNNSQNQAKYSDELRNKVSFGDAFNSYVLSGANENRFRLFSIHALKVGNACFIYEAEIDAIEDTGQIIEVKTTRYKKEVERGFQAYKNVFCGNSENNEKQKITRTISKSILQGELGNVSKFIYGFTMDGRVTTEEFQCYPGTLLPSKLTYLRDFVDLLIKTNIDNMPTFEEYEYWNVSKAENSTTLINNRKILGKLENWTNVERKSKKSNGNRGSSVVSKI